MSDTVAWGDIIAVMARKPNPELEFDPVLLAIRLWFFRLVPFLDRWAEAAPACCGTCPTCVGATATGAAMTWVGSLQRSRD